jgi:RNA polymerase sigma factor (TIGR02999 family)
MGASEAGQITEILEAINGGNRDALQQLFPLVYDRLRQMARIRMAHEPAQTLQTTALVHEVYLRLLQDKQPAWESRRHFFAVAAEAMRRILVESARKRSSLKRGGGNQKLVFSENLAAVDSNPDLYLMFDDALELLNAQDPRMCEVVKLRCFAGLTVEETALAMGLSRRNVDRAWAAAKAWLFHRLSHSTHEF